MQLRYSEEPREEYESQALHTIKPSLYPDDAEPLAVDLAGTCPRCEHGLPAARRWLVAVSPITKLNDRDRRRLAADLRAAGVDLSHGDETFELSCQCDEEHPGRPEGRKGCGATFDLRVVWP
jgi:hypothetical protein